MAVDNVSLDRIERGSIITARFLNAGVDQINALTSVVARPRQLREPRQQAAATEKGADEEDKIADESDGVVEVQTAITAEAWSEISRRTQTVRIFQRDAAGNITNEKNFVDVERITQITFVAQLQPGVIGLFRLILTN